MHVLPAKHCALLYPIEPKENMTNQGKVIKSEARVLKGLGGEIYGYGLKIPAKNTLVEFREEMKDVEEELTNAVNKFVQ